MNRFHASYPASPPSVRTIRGQVVELAKDCGLNETELADVALAVSEAATNAVLHGSVGDAPCVHITVALERGDLHIVVCDEGGGIRPKLDSSGAGLGMPVIASLTKSVDFVSDENGTEVHMRFPCPAAA